MTALVEQGIPGGALFFSAVLWLVLVIWRLRKWNSPKDDPDLTTMAAAIAGCLTSVMVAGLATDYLLAEVQFWMFAALVCAIQLRQGLVAPVPRPAHAPALALKQVGAA